jgi:hypothetical protein
MPLTQKQIENIHALPPETVKELLYECIEKLGVVDIEEAETALSVQRSRIYQLMQPNNTLKIGKHKFLMLNA